MSNILWLCELQVEFEEFERTDDVDNTRYKDLLELKEALGQSWDSDVDLINESYLKQYIKKELQGCVEIPESLEPYIDYDKYAEDCETDYSTVEFEDVTWYYRG